MQWRLIKRGIKIGNVKERSLYGNKVKSFKEKKEYVKDCKDQEKCIIVNDKKKSINKVIFSCDIVKHFEEKKQKLQKKNDERQFLQDTFIE